MRRKIEIDEQTKKLLENNLSNFPEMQRKVAQMVFLDGVNDYNAVARSLGIEYGQVTANLSIIRRKINLLINGLSIEDKRKLPRRVFDEESGEFYRSHLDVLPQKQQVVMEKWMELKNQVKVAEALNVNIGTVSRQITLACSKLDKYLHEEEPVPMVVDGKPYKFAPIACSTEFISQHLVYLPPMQNDIIKKYYLDHKTHYEIAKELNIKPATVLQVVYNARKKLEDFSNGADLPILKNGKPFALKRKRNWDNDFVNEHLKYLSPLQAKVATLFYIENMSYEEIASTLNTTFGNARTSVTNAKIKLNKMHDGTFVYHKPNKPPVQPYLYYYNKFGYDKEFVAQHLDVLTPLQAKIAQGIFIDEKSAVQLSKELSTAQSNISVYLTYIKKKFDKIIESNEQNQ